MKKFAFIGAGSLIFTRNVVKDILTFPAFADAEICLMDIDPEKLDYIRRGVEKIVEMGGYPATVTATDDRARALDGADGVVITILQGGVNVFRTDVEIPKKYGVDINVGDTRGPSGIFRMLRTLPVMLDILKDVERYCPRAIVLNYTNPMAMLCYGMQKMSDVCVTGLCHSVQGTASMLAGWIGAPMEEVSYFCAGVNHQAWYLRYEWKGQNAYPLIRQKIRDQEYYEKEIVRNEMFRHLDYYVTESSGHNSEYVAWFRKRPDLIERYCNRGTSWNPGVYGFSVDLRLKRQQTWKDDFEKWLSDGDMDLSRGHEYASYIFNAVFGDGTPFEFNGNVPNDGIIDNLPRDCCVEVPVLAGRRGIDPFKVGSLPDHLAVINNTTARCESLAVQGALEGDRRKVFHAVLNDPLTAAVLSMQETADMVDEMFAANRDYLGYFR